MGQREIFEYLKKHKKEWLTAKEISLGMNVQHGGVTTSLRKMRGKLVAFRERDISRHIYEYKIK